MAARAAKRRRLNSANGPASSCEAMFLIWGRLSDSVRIGRPGVAPQPLRVVAAHSNADSCAVFAR